MAPNVTRTGTHVKSTGGSVGGGLRLRQYRRFPHREVIEHAVVSTPPLCMYRRGLWGASQHFLRNLPESGRAGGQVTFGIDGEKRDSIYSRMGSTTKVPTAVEFPPSMSKQIMGDVNSMPYCLASHHRPDNVTSPRGTRGRIS